MALKVPEAFMSETRPRAKSLVTEEPRLFRLPEHHRETLRDVAQGEEESDVGLCCTYLVDSASGEGRDYDEHALNALEAYAESALTFEHLGTLFGHAVVSSWREQIRRSRRALALLRDEGDHQSANVLMTYYGHPDPLARQIDALRAMGSLGSLARHADAVEEKRRELVRILAADPTRRFAPLDKGLTGRAILGTTPGDERDAARDEVRERKRAAPVVSLVRHRDRLAWADRSVSSADALRAALAPFPEPAIVPTPDESVRDAEQRREARRRRQAEYATVIDRFVSRLRIEATRLLSSAEQAYHSAWIDCRGTRGRASVKRPWLGYVGKDVPIPPARVRGAGWSST